MFLHVDLGSFFVAVARRRRPDLIGRPVVIGGRPGSRGAVAAASREARRCGVRAGMPLAQAAVCCPDGVFVDGRFEDGFAAAQQVDALLRRETTEIEWASVDEVIAGLPAALAPPDAVALAERLHAAISDLGFDVACGVARSKLVARVASQLARPRGVVHVLDGYESRFLAPLKIEVLPGVGPALAARLRAAGIRRLGQIARLPEAQLALLAGRAAPDLARKAAGIDSSRIRRTALPPPRIGEQPLPHATSDRAALTQAIAQEAARVAGDLRSRALFARAVTLRVRFADGRVESRTAPLDEPSAIDEVLLARALDLLPRIAAEDRVVKGVALSCSGLLSGAGDLFMLGEGRASGPAWQTKARRRMSR